MWAIQRVIDKNGEKRRARKAAGESSPDPKARAEEPVVWRAKDWIDSLHLNDVIADALLAQLREKDGDPTLERPSSPRSTSTPRPTSCAPCSSRTTSSR